MEHIKSLPLSPPLTFTELPGVHACRNRPSKAPRGVQPAKLSCMTIYSLVPVLKLAFVGLLRS